MIFLLNSLDKNSQIKIIKDLSKIIYKSPFFTPTLPRFNKPFKIKISNAGKWGWISNIQGYQYVEKHPETKKNWPEIPSSLLYLWQKHCCKIKMPDSCLINLYSFPNSSLGLHQDNNEKDLTNPVLSISLGSNAIFRYGKNKTNLNEICLKTGSICILKDSSRLYYHGVKKIQKVKENIIDECDFDCFPKNCRINITLRKFEG
tara:strand:- start:104 stop:712 length:609 start_codon:yes stop_codon:yes gene_type:complete